MKTNTICRFVRFYACFAAILIGFSSSINAGAETSFSFTNITEKSLALFEGSRPVFVYNHGSMHQQGVPLDRARGTYIHPLFGMDGEILSDDFPKDHYHHRGLFWAWPHVRVGEKHYDLWMLNGIEQRFVRWLEQSSGSKGAALGVENGWYVNGQKIVREEVRIHATPSNGEERFIDLEFVWTPLTQPLTLRGAEGKSYGGLTLRFAPRTETVITSPLGQGKEDLSITRLPWADLSARFGGRSEASGAAIFVAPDHPDFPPEWLTRHYGVLCLGWPGVTGRTFRPGESIRCRYRVWIHRGSVDVEAAAEKYEKWISALHDSTKRKKVDPNSR